MRLLYWKNRANLPFSSAHATLEEIDSTSELKGANALIHFQHLSL